MRRPILLTAAAAVLAGLGLVSPSAVRAATTDDFDLAGHSVDVNMNTATATFRLSFTREPRFFVTPGGEEQPDAFQIEIDADHTIFDRPILFEDVDSVVRGAEISATDGIPVRDREGDGGGEEAGGWGPVRGFAPFELDGATLAFTTNLQTIADTDGKFRYRIITIENGSLTSEVSAAIIPIPVALGGGMMMLGGAALVHKLRGRSFR
jgi:hypothetical protein